MWIISLSIFKYNLWLCIGLSLMHCLFCATVLFKCIWDDGFDIFTVFLLCDMEWITSVDLRNGRFNPFIQNWNDLEVICPYFLNTWVAPPTVLFNLFEGVVVLLHCNNKNRYGMCMNWMHRCVVWAYE